MKEPKNLLSLNLITSFTIMKTYLISIVICSFLHGCASNETEKEIIEPEISKAMEIENNMKLGAFSISIAVKDLIVSKNFYETLGFSQMGGDVKMNYLIMKNEDKVIGLFQGMFEKNILTFNPGWNQNAEDINGFKDIREIQEQLLKDGIEIDTKIDKTTSGPASFMITDPDGNAILFDQHR